MATTPANVVMALKHLTYELCDKADGQHNSFRELVDDAIAHVSSDNYIKEHMGEETLRSVITDHVGEYLYAWMMGRDAW